MRRFALTLLVVVVLAAAADAVSVAIAPDKPFYLPGETVNLIVTVDARDGGLATQVGGTFQYDPTILLGGSMTQTALTAFGGLPWILPPSSVLPCGGGTCFGFGQVAREPGLPADQGPDFAISTITFTAGAPGVTDILWTTVGPTALTFFGMTSAPGTSVEVVVPEPATAALLVLGLCALRGVRSRR
jgi:hypothetical protein